MSNVITAKPPLRIWTGVVRAEDRRHCLDGISVEAVHYRPRRRRSVGVKG